MDEYGETHYDALNHPHLYFQMLILTAQFEAAIEFLTRVARYKVHGVHMGIALHELYMLLGPRDVSSPLSRRLKKLSVYCLLANFYFQHLLTL